MKGFFSKAFVLTLGVILSTGVFAHKNHQDNSKMWTCETNASSASSDADKKADDMMSKKAMSGKDAFSFALKHCRDCNKITCSVESKDNSSSQPKQ